MAAGLGFKTFTTGEVLTAADTNGYLMQGVNVFASAAARTAAITSPQEGQMSYLKDTNSTEYYSGAAWVAIGGSTGANWSLVNAGGTALTGAGTITVSGISGANQIFVLCSYVGSASASSLFSFRFNADSGSNYIMSGVLEGTASNDLLHTGSTTGIQFATMGNNAGNTVTPAMLVNGSATSGVKIFDCVAMGNGTGAVGRSMKGVYSGSSAITSVSIISSIGNFDEGTIWVYTTA
jgi:hypothetical protein